MNERGEQSLFSLYIEIIGNMLTILLRIWGEHGVWTLPLQGIDNLDFFATYCGKKLGLADRTITGRAHIVDIIVKTP